MGALEQITRQDGINNIIYLKKYVENNIKAQVTKKSSNIAPDNTGVTTWVDPIKSRESIDQITQYFQQKIDDAKTVCKRNQEARNKLLFMLGIMSGFRVSDLKKVTWGVFFDKNTNFHDNPQNIIEQKTGKTRRFQLTNSVKKYIQEYVATVQPDIIADNYIFTSQKKLYEIYDIRYGKAKIIDDVDITVETSIDEYKKLKHRGLTERQLDIKIEYLKKYNIPYKVRQFYLTEAGIRKVVKQFAEDCGLKGNYAGRSLRKTYAYRGYEKGMAAGLDPLTAAGKIKSSFNHSSFNDTTRYLGIEQERDLEFWNSVFEDF